MTKLNIINIVVLFIGVTFGYGISNNAWGDNNQKNKEGRSLKIKLIHLERQYKYLPCQEQPD